MNDWMYSLVSLDLLPLIAGVLSALSCGLLGNHLVLRQQSLMGDAISHAVLPGLVIAFLISGTRNPAIMFVGAAGSAVLTVVLIQIVRRLGRVEPGAAMGVIFSVLFAAGVLLLEQAAARSVDLDASCVLYGQLETLFWFPPRDTGSFLSLETMSLVPRQIWTLLGVTIAVIAFMLLFYKELRISAFDPSIATSQGINAPMIQFVLMIFVAAAAVASFEAVGSILVIAMLICPAATARLLTDQMRPQIMVSAIIAITSAISGYAVAANIPEPLVRGGSINAAGMITVMSGVLLVGAIICSPSHGTIAKSMHRRKLRRRIELEDLLATLFRVRESGQTRVPHAQLIEQLGLKPETIRTGLTGDLVVEEDGTVSLTDAGFRRASGLIRKHRLWEGYLVDQAGMLADHVHPVAEALEHLESPTPRESDAPRGDQHGNPVPPAN